MSVIPEMPATAGMTNAGMLSTKEALARSERQRAEVERIAQVGSWEWDVASNRITWSDELFRIFGMEPHRFDPTYEAYVARLHPDDRERVAATVRHAMETAAAFSHTHRVIHQDGSEHMILGRGEVIRDAEGNVVRMVGTAQDITVRVALERETAARQAAEAARELLAQQAREAVRARAEAESANRAKAEFLATMSHELRTPINAALGYSELLAMGVRGPVTQAQLDDLDRIRRSQRLLLSLVNDILNFARLEAGQIEFRVTNVALHEVLETIEAMIAPQVAAKELIYAQTGCDGDVTVRADDEKLQQVLLNLLTNAVKFTDAGGRIELVCRVDDEWVELTVCDTGRGIAADQLERVFEPFVQVDRHLTHSSQQGVGLGLAISRDLIRGMGGDLGASSEVGKGSTFVARLPRGT